MSNMARKLFLREIKNLKWQRKLSTSVVLRKDDFIIKSSIPDIVIPQNMRLIDRVWSESAGYKNLVALESAETKKTYTYTQLEKNTATFATSLLKKFGLKSGDVVAVMLPNCPEFPVVALGCLQAGCVLTTVNPIYKEFEIAHQASITEPKIIVTIPECYDNVLKGLKSAKIQAKIVLVADPSKTLPSDVSRYSEVAESGEVDFALLDKVEKKGDDVACIPFSSGTTGLPKGVEISYDNLMAAMSVMHQPENCFPELAHANFQDILPIFLPFFHIYGFVVGLIGHLTKGCKLVTMAKFSASLYLDILKNQRSTLLYIVPPVAILLGKHPDVNEKHYSDVRHIICGAAPLSASDVQAILQKSKRDIEFNQGFGMTETTSLGTSTFKKTKNVDFNACGVPMANMQLKFADPITGEAVPVGQSGEMLIRGPTIMKQYHKNPKATQESMTEDGFFKTGDLGYFQPGVGLFITDRIKELIKVKGMQVAPAELESILRSHPAVQDAAVIGVPHEFYGEAPKAFIIRKNGLKISEEELQDFVASKVAVYKKIEEVMFVEDIPKTASGKILRKELKKMYA
ncbi:4-coumarate--CoA ligase-like isoform X1 [Trichoplusia ni]|uniref:4-coumarate--CoA ligase-like isoform X1 n=1 Tax=Trichoplusia ni TaxID=7111 RepID=A0A7E5VR15_TRINI|nr:4-coumarate--CoA ligase-like isoform X1 [Trichoplusia ni]